MTEEKMMTGLTKEQLDGHYSERMEANRVEVDSVVLLSLIAAARASLESRGERDACEMCLGAKGAVPGNENRHGGVVMCDYCSVLHCRASDASGAESMAGWVRPESEWHEDIGDVLWWRFPIVEAPYVGSPLDTDWPGYHTHWTRFSLPSPPKVTP